MTERKTLTLNAFQIKCLACLFMLIDHIGMLMIEHTSPGYIYFRMAGRLAFPMFAYMIANGYRHTLSVGKYLLRLIVFAVLIQAVYAFALKGEDINIFSTLAMGLISIIAWEKLKQSGGRNIPGTIAVILAAAAAQLLNMDYGAYGVLLIFTSHMFYGQFSPLALVWTALALVAYSLHWVGSSQMLAVCALVIIALYNEKPGPHGFWAKWGFYLFYCFHLPLLYLISQLV